jgi:hypothetical protein
MDEFDAEFRGLFWGEGTISIDAMSNKRRSTGERFVYPRLRVSMASWERPMLEAIRDRYGGCITTASRDASITWHLSGRTRLERIVDVLSQGVLPSPKLEELKLFAEAVSLVAPKGGHHTPERRQKNDEAQARLRQIKEEMSALKFGGRGSNRSRKLSRELEEVAPASQS